jgi:hypothetical protein
MFSRPTQWNDHFFFFGLLAFFVVLVEVAFLAVPFLDLHAIDAHLLPQAAPQSASLVRTTSSA